MRSHHQRELLGLDRLHEVVGGAHAQRADGALDRGVGREQHEIGAGLLAAHALEQLEAGEAGHGQIGDDEIRRLARERLERRLGALAALDARLRRERLARQLAGEAVVVDDDDPIRAPRVAAHFRFSTPITLDRRSELPP